MLKYRVRTHIHRCRLIKQHRSEVLVCRLTEIGPSVYRMSLQYLLTTVNPLHSRATLHTALQCKYTQLCSSTTGWRSVSTSPRSLTLQIWIANCRWPPFWHKVAFNSRIHASWLHWVIWCYLEIKYDEVYFPKCRPCGVQHRPSGVHAKCQARLCTACPETQQQLALSQYHLRTFSLCPMIKSHWSRVTCRHMAI